MTYTQGGRSRTVTLRAGEVGEVRAGLARYERARAELEQAAAEGLAAWRGRRAAPGAGR